MLKVYETITGLKKAATKREAERKELADVIEQEKLIEIKGGLPYWTTYLHLMWLFQADIPTS